MDVRTESVERYLADRDVAYSFEELSKNLNIPLRKLVRMINELKSDGLVEIRYMQDVAYIAHIHWVVKRSANAT